MQYDPRNRTFDCDPTLTDHQMLEFCRRGYLLLQGVVLDEINQHTCDYLDGKIEIDPFQIPDHMVLADLERIRKTHEPSSILLEQWFLNQVILNSQAAGAIRSILGKNAGLPILMSNHRVECPQPAQGWHHDADSIFSPETNYLQVFYYPQDTPVEMGPTEVLPGSHHRPTSREIDWCQGGLTTAPAGSIFLTCYPILHRRSASTATGLRHMLKYNYWRTVPPERDWIKDPTFDFHRTNYGGHGEARYVAHQFYWLCGKGNQFRTMGGQSWPYSGSSHNAIGPSYGFDRQAGHSPDWSNLGTF